MRNVFVLLYCCLSFSAMTQNVGIGTPVPTGRLQINHRTTYSSSGLRLVDSTPNWGGSLEFKNLVNPATTRMVVSGFSESIHNNGQYLDIVTDSSFVATFKGSGMLGIRNSNPQYPMDVNGDINLTSNHALRVNGNAGTEGQVLRSNGDGSMQWGDMNEYSNYEIFRTAGSNTWTVPAGVTKICIELWGGGGGASIHGGGGGGGYIRAYFTVTPGTVVNYTIGAGGNGGNFSGSSGVDGTTSTASVNGILLSGGGGGGSSFFPAAGENPGGGGIFFVSPSSFRNYTGENGEPGHHNQTTYQQRSSTVFVVNTKYGNGGNAGNSRNTAGIGNYTITIESPASIVKESYSEAPRQPGGGGGVFYCSVCTNNAGANGQMIIRY